MKNFFILLFFTLFALDVSAQFRPSQSQYFDIDNTFKNMGFEQGYDGWDITTTCTKSVEVEVPYLNRSLKLVCVAQDFEVSQTTSALSGLDIMGLSSVKMSTTALGVEYKIFNDLTETINREIPINAKVARYEIPYVIDELDNTAKLTATSYTGTVIIDDFKLGIAPEGYTQGVQVVSDINTYTMNIGATTTPPSKGSISIDEARYWREGQNLMIRYDFVQTSAGSNGTGTYLFPLPDDLVIDVNEIPLESATNVGVVGKATGGNASVAYIGHVKAHNSTNLSLVFGDSSAQGFPVGSTAVGLGGASTRFSFLAKVPIVGWSATPIDFISQKRELTAKTVNVFGAEISSAGVATGDSYNFINGDCTFTGGNTYTCPLSDMNITKRLICSDAQNATSNEVTYSLSSSTTELVFFVPSAVAFNITCVKHDDDLNKSIEGIMTLNETSIVQNRDKYSETEIKWGLWNGEQLYRKCVSGSMPDGTTITSSASKLIDQSGYYDFNASTIIPIPFDNGTLRFYPKWESGNGIVIEASATYTGQVCVEYLK